jgi:hypothetical protein
VVEEGSPLYRYFSRRVTAGLAVLRVLARAVRQGAPSVSSNDGARTMAGSKNRRGSAKEPTRNGGRVRTAPSTTDLTLTAYRVSLAPRMRLVPASSSRTWMLATSHRFANRCLPLLMANQSGWFVLNSHPLSVTWTGGDDIASVQVEYLGGSPPYPALSHFGYGLLTWSFPYLFQTSPGYNLLVRGPANWPKDGAYPLEGIVETDWSVATFTMNWKLTRPNQPVTFEANEPICMLVPQQRGELEAFRPEIRDIGDEPEMRRRYEQWSQSRARFLEDLKVPGSEAVKRGWQGDYFRGRPHDGLRAPEHQTKRKLQDFDGP